MAVSRTARSAIIAAALAAMVGTSITTSAEANGYRRHYGGEGLALGIGSLIVGGIIAGQHHRRHYRHRSYDNTYYAPTYGYYSAGPRFYSSGGHRHHRRHWR